MDTKNRRMKRKMTGEMDGARREEFGIWFSIIIHRMRA